MKNLLLSLMFLLLTGLAAAAATSYGFKVGNVEVTTANYNNVTGNDIITGTVSYNPSTNVLTLNNASISCSNSGEYAIHNINRPGLVIKCVGDCYLSTQRSYTINMEKGTTIEVTSGSTVYVSLYNSNSSDLAVFYSNNVPVTIKGPGFMNVNAETSETSSEPKAFKGSGKTSSSTLTFENIEAYVITPGTTLMGFNNVKFNANSDVKFISGSNYYNFFNIGSLTFNGNEAIVQPADAYLGSSGYLVHDEPYVHITNNYGVILSTANFPDANFRTYMRSGHAEQYLTPSELQNLTSLNVSHKSISSLKGVEKLIYLKNLMCYNNSIEDLDVSSNTRLEYLDCDNNRLTSLTLPPASNSPLRQIRCASNDFTSLYITDRPNLTALDASNNTSMLVFNCSRNKLSSLDVTGCSALTEFQCYGSNHTVTTLNLAGTTGLTLLDCSYCSKLSTITNLESCTSMERLLCYYTAISSLSAVSNMSNLKYLDCEGTQITSLNVCGKRQLTTLYCMNNSQLKELYCYNSALTLLDCTNCPALETIKCWGNSFTTLNMTGNTALTYLDCAPNANLTTITSLSNCKAMETLICYSTSISDLSDVAYMTNLDLLNCNSTKLTSLTIRDKSKLTAVYCHSNPQLTDLTVTNCPKLNVLGCHDCTDLTDLSCYMNDLTTIDVSGNTALVQILAHGNDNLSKIEGLSNCKELETLEISDCDFSSIDLSGLTKLSSLYCDGNKLTSLNVSALTSLTTLYCFGNQLNSLNVPNKTNLTYLYCQGNKLMSLNVQGCSKLRTLLCETNRLTSLNVQGCTALKTLRCYQNQISGAGMTTLVNSLPTRTASDPGEFYAIYDTNEGNRMTASQITTAKNKLWPPLYDNGYDWVVFTGTFIGDVNNDGTVNISDVTALIDLLAGSNPSSNTAADVNYDGVVDIGDVTALYDKLLSSN